MDEFFDTVFMTFMGIILGLFCVITIFSFTLLINTNKIRTCEDVLNMLDESKGTYVLTGEVNISDCLKKGYLNDE